MKYFGLEKFYTRINNMNVFSMNSTWEKFIFSFIVTIVVASLMSVFHDPYGTITSWADQIQALADLKKAVNPDQKMYLPWAGPGWLTLASITHFIFGINLESSLILVNRVSYLAAVFIFSIFIFIHVMPVKKSWFGYTSVIVLLCTFFLSVNFTYFSTIPWSHFIALPFSCAIFLLLSNYKCNKTYNYILIGVLVGFLATIRMFSAQAIVAAVIFWFIYLLWRKRASYKCVLKNTVRIASLCLLGFVLGYLIHALILGEFVVYRQYKGMVLYPLTDLYSLRLTDFPVKFIQLFVDPCFLSDCSLNQWSKATTYIVNDGNNSWRYPLLLQIPIIGWVAYSWFIYIAYYWRYIPRILEDPVVAILLLTSCAIILGYTSVLVGGADRLKFGYVRDYMDATFLLFMATVRVMMLLNNLNNLNGLKFTHNKKIMVIVGAPVISIFLLQTSISGNNFIKFPEYAINSIDAAVSCTKEECRFKPYYISSTGRHDFPLAFDDVVMKTLCSEGGKPIFWYGRMSEYSYRRNQCRNGATIVFIPTITSASTRIVGPDYNGEYGGKVYLDWYQNYKLDTKIVFGLSGNDKQYIGSLGGDWSHAEEDIRWTSGKKVRLSLLIKESKSLVLKANVAGYIRKEHPELHVDVLVENKLVTRWSINSDQFKDYAVIIPADVLPEDNKLDLEFVIHNPISPLEIGESTDSRNLGLAFRNISISATR